MESVKLIDTGLFPDLDDPEFQEKLLKKQEFYESYQDEFKYDEEDVSCKKDGEFELTAVQRFIGRFLSPQTPYNSALLYHGVGVGKTCAAIVSAEAYLEIFPNRKVLIIAPKNIQPNFYRTIFNINNVKLGLQKDDENVALGCTGNLYLKLAGVQFERDKRIIENRVYDVIKKRYLIMGYLKFRNYILGILKVLENKKFGKAILREKKGKLLRREFSGRMIIIDEAHNLRDPTPLREDDEGGDLDAPGGKDEVESSNEGGKLVPYLEDLLQVSEGTKLLLLSGTPMYNNYKEIISILRLLKLNDTKEFITENQIFDREGGFVPGGREFLGELASRYVSFMRGENPNQFPLRLKPETGLLEAWPTNDPKGDEIDGDQEDLLNLPLVPCELVRPEFLEKTEEVIGSNRIGVIAITNLVQSGNCGFPIFSSDEENEENSAAAIEFGPDGFDSAFELKGNKYTARTTSKWLEKEQLVEFSPKIAKSIDIAQKAEGIIFVYSRFVKAGALIYALALEANGYTNADIRGNFLTNAVSDKQCALCPRKKSNHVGQNHPFSPAYYILLTGSLALSTNNEKAIDIATNENNKNGKRVKVIIGSQIAAEGIDLKYLREIHILDSWLHLNKMEQVIGRGIRYCSHSALDKNKRNCTIYMFVNTFDNDNETIDLYSYRVAYNKSKLIGNVSRVLKEYALDCNLNLPAILINDDRDLSIIDSQRKERDVKIKDMPFSPVCDWLRNCEYTCAKPVEKARLENLDDTTYDLFSQKWKESQMKMALKRMFASQTHYRDEDIEDIFKSMNVPDIILAKLLREVLGNRQFKVRHKNIEGYIIYKNGYYLFQPFKFVDLEIPLSLRGATMPVRKESFYPGLFKSRVEPEEEGEGEEGEEEREGEGEGEERAEEGEEGEGEGEEGEEEPVKTGGIPEIWKQAILWINQVIRSNGANTSTPEGFEDAVKIQTEGKENDFKLLKEKIDTIMWWVPSIKGVAGALDTFHKIFLDYIWDEWLSEGDQRRLLEVYLDDENVQQAGRENRIKSGSRIVYRYKNPGSETLRYICDGVPCSKSVIDFLQSKDNVKVDKVITGEVYGFLVGKKGKQVFKSSSPPGSNKKLLKGQECENVSNSTGKIELLEKVGKVLSTHGFGTKLDLTEAIVWGEDVVVNGKKIFRKSSRNLSARKMCVLMDLVLRWMDEKGVSDKRWFYRPISSTLAGHPDS